jgi:hypothetical protein
VLRSGYPDATGQQCERGRRIVLARDVAEAAAQAGAIEIITSSPAPSKFKVPDGNVEPATTIPAAANDAGQEITPQ